MVTTLACTNPILRLHKFLPWAKYCVFHWWLWMVGNSIYRVTELKNMWIYLWIREKPWGSKLCCGRKCSITIVWAILRYLTFCDYFLVYLVVWSVQNVLNIAIKMCHILSPTKQYIRLFSYIYSPFIMHLTSSPLLITGCREDTETPWARCSWCNLLICAVCYKSSSLNKFSRTAVRVSV